MDGRPPPMMGRGPMDCRPPPMMGRAPPRPGPPIPNSGIPPPPPRGSMGHPLPSRDRPPQFHHPPPPRMPPLPMRGRPPPMRMGPPPNNTAQPQFQQRQFQHVAPPSNIPGVVPQFSGNPPNHLQASRPAQTGPLTYNKTAGYSNIPIASAPLATATTQHQSTMRQVASQPVQAAARKPTPNQIDQAWKEYTAANGVKYYHNAILKESTYTKPIMLTKKEATAAAHTKEKRKWQEYEDASTGKTYYSDGVTTTWEKPIGFTTDAHEAAQSEEPEPAKKKKKSSANPASSFSSKEEAIAAFKGLLLAKGVVPTIKWNEVVKIISSDSRWEGCKDALSVGERRQALAEYQTKRTNDLRDLERQERIRAKDAFGQLLTDILPSISGFSPLGCRFSDVRSTLAKDDRFHAVATEHTRESLFLDFCEELRKRDERKKRSKKREAHDAFLSFLREREEAGKLTFASTW
jgi:pre-mRNA-processing factor 40